MSLHKPTFAWLIYSDSEYLSWYSGVRLGLQQLGPSGFRIYRQPANSTAGQQLPAEQGGGEYSLWSALLYGCSGQWRGNGSFRPADGTPFSPFWWKKHVFIYHVCLVWICGVCFLCRSMVGATIAMDSSVWETMETSRRRAGSLHSKVSTSSRSEPSDFTGRCVDDLFHSTSIFTTFFRLYTGCLWICAHTGTDRWGVCLRLGSQLLWPVRNWQQM